MVRPITLILIAWIMASPVNAARLGKLRVLSAVGQPVSAEIEILATEEERPTLSTGLVLLDGFGDDQATALARAIGLKVELSKRDANPVLKITSDKPANQAEFTVLVELRWASGKRMHEYSISLAPSPLAPTKPSESPDTSKPALPALALPPMSAPAAPSPMPVVSPTPAAASPPLPAKAAPVTTPPLPDTPPVATATTRQIKKGDTLSTIAQETRHEKATLTQMLVAYIRSSPEAFVSGNMNRMIEGKILNIPEESATIAIDKREARDIYITQAAEFEAYRKKLAKGVDESPVKEGAPATQSTAGKIVRAEPKPVAPPKDKLEVSSGAKSAASKEIEDKISTERALADSTQRIKALEKNIADMQALVAGGGGAMPKPAVPKKTDYSNHALLAAFITVVLILAGFLMRRNRAKPDEPRGTKSRKRTEKQDDLALTEPSSSPSQNDLPQMT